MSNEEKKDYGATLNLPKTDFPMRANLPENEPKILEKISSCRENPPNWWQVKSWIPIGWTTPFTSPWNSEFTAT